MIQVYILVEPELNDDIKWKAFELKSYSGVFGYNELMHNPKSYNLIGWF